MDAPAPLRYRELRIEPQDPALMEVLNGLLSAWPFEAFAEEEDPPAWTAWMPDGALDEATWREAVDGILALVPGLSAERFIEAENWNAAWEAAFPPVSVSPRTRIRAPFHAPDPGVEVELVIEPKMSFGTGHHDTTRLVLRMLEDEPLEGRSVLDLGTGTGVLAIYAHRRGAAPVRALDHHPFSVENARENAERNDAAAVAVEAADLLDPAGAWRGDPVDLVLANINRHVLEALMPGFPSLLHPGGTLILSGILAADGPALREAARLAGLVFVDELGASPPPDPASPAWVAQRYRAASLPS
jgi:ribosomal protein L11 methyltransferase